ncbi:hypothetical protein AVEN_202895-1 [Araneus ventricosus]|uniref:Uncharacterized protein n=1 Tax=Araneus ventricosus TaxID=182803 RepID=A0A4Y2FNU3_ARAVE|nr:hypothetical protein AVEN_202895-1 [Araneus ventricosus]
MDLWNGSPLFSSLRVVEDMNGRPVISYLYLKGPFNDHSPNCLLPLSEQQPAEIHPTSIEVAWPATSGLGVSVNKELVVFRSLPVSRKSHTNLRTRV